MLMAFAISIHNIFFLYESLMNGNQELPYAYVMTRTYIGTTFNMMNFEELIRNER